MAESPKLLARGSLGKVPLADFLIRALDDAVDGTLILQGSDGSKDAVLFSKGAPAKARINEQSVFLSEVLVDLELVPRSVAVSTRKRADEMGKAHGTVLVEEGYLDETGLYVGLREQLTRQVLALCDRPDDTFFGLYQANYLASWGPSGQWRVKPLPLIWRSLVEHLPESRRQAVLAHAGDHPLRIRVESPVARYRMTPKERSVVDMLRAKAQTRAQLEQSGAGTVELVDRVVCALLLSRQLEGFGQEKMPVGYHEPPETPQSVVPPPLQRRTTSPNPRSLRAPVPGTPAARPAMPSAPAGRPTPSGRPAPPVRPGTPVARPPGQQPVGQQPAGQQPPGPPPPVAPGSAPRHAPPRPEGAAVPRQPGSAPHHAAPVEGDGGLSEEHAAFQAEVEAYEQHPPATFYDLLGVEHQADTNTIRKAFFALARRWHPDKLPKQLEELRPVVQRAFARMGEAHQVLSDPARRREYDEKLGGASDEEEQEKVAQILEAASAFQRAEVLNKKRDYEGALREARLALEGDPEQADYLALVAWLEAALYGNGEYSQQMAMLDEAIESDPNNVRALWYRGQLFKRMKKHLPAMRDFKRILKIQPRHVEAKRELRVFEMRKRSDAKTNSGFFGRLLKKD